MKKIKALVLSLLSLSVVGAFSGCSFEALLGMMNSSSESTPTNSESSTPDESTPDESTPDDGGEGDVTPDVPAADSLITIAKANELGLSKEHNNYTSDKFYVEGTVKSIDMDKNDPTKYSAYGNMYIEDAEGNTLYVYGVYGSQGKARFDSMKTKPAVGDTVKFYGVIGQYNGTAQMKNGWTMEINGEAQKDVAAPLSGSGAINWDDDFNAVYDYYVIKSGNIYSVSASDMEAGSNGFEIVSDKDGTYTLDLVEDWNNADATTNVSIEGVEIPLNEDYQQLADGFSFPVKANTPVRITINSSVYDEENWTDVYYDAYFSLTFDKNTFEADGSQLAPIALENGATYTVGGSNAYYSFTAPSAGYYKLTVNADWSVVADNFNFYDADYNALLRGAAVEIAEGETISFFAANYIYDEETYDTLPTSWTFTFGADVANDDNFDTPAVLGSYETPLEIYMTGDYEITIPVAENAYYVVLCDAFQFVVPTGTVAEVDYEITFSGNVVAFVNYDMMWNNQLLVCFHIEDRGATEDLTVSFTVTDYVAEDGGEDLGDAIEEGTIEVTTTDNYTMYDVDSYTFTAPVAGKYVFSIPGGLGFWSDESKVSNPYGTPEVDYYDNQSGATVEVELAANAEYKFWLNCTIKGDYIISWAAYEAEIEDGGEEEVVDTVLEVGANSFTLAADNYSTGVTFTFTAELTGAYTFGTGGSFFFQVYNNGAFVANHMTGPINLEAGVTYDVILAGIMAGNYTLTIAAPEAGEVGGEEDDEEEVVDTVLEVGSNKVVIAETNNSVEEGALFTIVPTAKGLYQFKGDLMVVVYDADLNPIERVNYKYELNADEEYYVVFYYMAMIGFQNEGKYTITVSFEEIVEENDEGIDIFAAPIVTEANYENKIRYTFTLTEAVVVTFTFDNTDTWFDVTNAQNSVVCSGYSKDTYTATLEAGTYTMGIGTWTAETLTLTLTATAAPIPPADDSGDSNTVTYLTSHANGRKMKVVIDAANGTVSVTRSDMTGNFSGGATTYTGTYSFDGTTVTCEISGCTVTWNADGSPATVTWTVVYDNFAIAE